MLVLAKRFLLMVIFIFSLSLWASPAYALIQLSDNFKATNTCEAVQSIRNGTNSGNIKLILDRIYPVVGKNREDESHYLLRIEGAQPRERWVAKQCGQLLSSVPGETQNPPINNNESQRKEYLLALSWQPSFCETKPNKTECQTQTTARFDATNLALHGLWPQPRTNLYCGVSDAIIDLDQANQWDQLPPIELSAATRRALAEKMPGFASNLQLHEWYKHGTCYGTTPDQYFQDSMNLQDQVNRSQVQQLFANNLERDITATEIRASFDESFGAGAGNKVAVECKRDIDEDRVNMVMELQINLAGKIAADTAIDGLLAAGKTVNPGCTKGEVDRAGFN
jgi:ribonuclease T2